MEKKEQLEQFVGYIGQLTKLTEDVSAREIYPVSFFSQAFDITRQMQEWLHRMEIAEVALFEQHMKEYQEQIQSVGRLSELSQLPQVGVSTSSLPPVPAAIPPEPPKPAPATTPPPVPTKEKTENRLNETIVKQKLADLRKAFTLNDRFLYCRELFARDEQKMNQILGELNEKDTYAASLAYLKERFDWDFESDTVASFTAVLEKRFL